VVSNYLHKTEPYLHQDRAVHFMFENFMRGITYGALFMEQGTGKSKVAIDIASNLFLMGKINGVLLIAPNGVQEQWMDEQVPIHSPVPYTPLLWEGLSSQRKIKEVFQFIKEPDKSIKWFFTNVEAFSYGTHLGMFQEYLTKNKIIAIVDEATRIKTPDANRTINIVQGLSSVVKDGKRVLGFTPYSLYRMILTGTQVTNSPFDLWSMMEFLQHDYFKRDYFSFCGHHGLQIQAKAPQNAKREHYYRSMHPSEMESIRKYYAAGKDFEAIAHIMKVSESSARFIVENPTIRAPYKHLDELKTAIQPVAFQVRKSDCLDLPPKTYLKRVVTMSGDQAQAYNELKEDLMATYGNMTLSIVNQLSMWLRLQQVTSGFFPCGMTPEGEFLQKPVPFKSNAKLEELFFQLEETDDYPIIVVGRFVPEIKLIAKELERRRPDLRSTYICGEVSNDKRANIIDAFKRKEVDVLVANARTIGLGYNLQVCHTVFFHSNSFSFEERAQMEDRIHRNGQKSDKVVYKDLVVKATVDERVLTALQGHKDLLDYMRDTGMTFKQFIGG
jgi:SNF2 family DNA or RNA helicase